MKLRLFLPPPPLRIGCPQYGHSNVNAVLFKVTNCAAYFFANLHHFKVEYTGHPNGNTRLHEQFLNCLSNLDTDHLTLGTVQLNQAPQQEVMSDARQTPAVISLATTGSRPNTISVETLQINIAQVVRCYECCQTFENAQLLQVVFLRTDHGSRRCFTCMFVYSLGTCYVDSFTAFLVHVMWRRILGRITSAGKTWGLRYFYVIDVYRLVMDLWT